jgi:hypothetical protein
MSDDARWPKLRDRQDADDLLACAYNSVSRHTDPETSALYGAVVAFINTQTRFRLRRVAENFYGHGFSIEEVKGLMGVKSKSTIDNDLALLRDLILEYVNGRGK